MKVKFERQPERIRFLSELASAVGKLEAMTLAVPAVKVWTRAIYTLIGKVTAGGFLNA